METHIDSIGAYLALAGFLILNFIVGTYKRKKTETLEDYALANHSFGSFSVMVTLAATVIGAKYVTVKITDVQEFGIVVPLFQALGFMMVIFFLGWDVFPRLSRYKNCYTIGDVIGRVYGKHAQLYTGAVSLFLCLFFVTSQLVMMGSLCKALGLRRELVILSVGGVITLYTYLGGIRAVTKTDKLQLSFVVMGFSFLAFKVLRLDILEGKGFAGLFKRVKEQYPDHLTISSHPWFWMTFLAIISLSTIFLTPPVIQRVLMAGKSERIHGAFLNFAFFYPFFTVMLVIIGLGLLLTHGPSKIGELATIDVMIKEICGGEALVEVLLFVVLTAVVMSSADSFLNSMVVVVLQDIVKPSQNSKKEKINELRWIKLITVVSGLSATILAVMFKKTWPANLLDFARTVFSSLLVIFIATLWGYKEDKRSFFYSVSTFLAMTAISGWLAYDGYLDKFFVWNSKMLLRRKMFYLFPFCLMGSALVLFGRYLLRKRALPRKTLH
ncbi:MAG: hypothetical protein AAF335_02480 [Bacteroidota bacterium]